MSAERANEAGWFSLREAGLRRERREPGGPPDMEQWLWPVAGLNQQKKITAPTF
ncbi:MAG: hypothetical protein V7708_17990 [Oceanicoccus sp.]